MTCVAYLLGMAAEELEPEEVAHYDPEHPLVAFAEVRKPVHAHVRISRAHNVPRYDT